MRILAKFFLSAALLMLGFSASAQTTTIPVRAGEHAQFTRLVIQVPEANSWRVTTDNLTAQLIVDGPPLQFDLSQTFSKIPRTRLRHAQATPGKLELHLACDCEIRAYEDIPQFLVIDILGIGQPVVTRPANSIRPPERPAQIQQSAPLRITNTARAGTNLARVMRGHTFDASLPASLTLQKFVDAGRGTDPQSAPEQPQENASDDSAYMSVTQELGRILAGSVAQGILEPASSLEDVTQARRTEDQTLPRRHETLADHLRLDRSDAGQNPQDAHEQETQLCHDLARLDLVEWTAGAAIDRTAPFLYDLYGEFDRLHQGKGFELMRHFLSLGFGAELRLVAELLELPVPLRDVINGISFVVDQQEVPDGLDLTGMRECGPAGKLWAFLGTPLQNLNSNFPFDDVVRYVDALPPHLRLHLGPEIIRRLTALGQIGPAMMIETALDRVAMTNSSDLQLAKVALALEALPTDGSAELENTLSPDISDNALLFLLSRRDRQGEPVETHLIELADSRRLALRGDPRAGELTQLLARALARNGAYPEAFSLAQAWDAGLSDYEILDLHQRLFDHLTDNAEDTAFVAQIFEQKPWSIDGLDIPVAQKIALRLSVLGFEEQAGLMRQHRSSASGNAQLQLSTVFPSAPSSFSDNASIESRDVRRARRAQLAAQMRSQSISEGSTASPTTPTTDEAESMQEAAVRDTTSGDIGTEEIQQQMRDDATEETAQQTSETGLLAQSREGLAQSAALRSRLEEMLIQRD